MLPKKYRLTGYQVSQTFKKGRFFNAPLFTLKFLPLKNISPNLENSLFSITVSLKIEKKAVKRNRIRRQVYEIIRHLLPDLKPGWAIAILAKKEILDKKYHQIEEELQKAFREIKIL